MVKNSKNFKNEFKNKKILVTGGTGSIGLAIVKKLINYKPKEIRIFSNDENSIFEAMKNLGQRPIFNFMVGDIKDRERVRMAMRGIDIVFHAAALKHIDICEQNPFDAVKTNVIGTSNLLEVSILEGISKFIFISTDKATNPSSTLGASKLLAERLTIDAGSYRSSNKTTFAIVRFGNVIGSRGSVFNIFLNQLKQKKPVTVTDKRMTRFIMSIPDSADLILKVTHVAKDGEIFILKMPSVRILDLAQAMILRYNKKFPSLKFSKIQLSKSRFGERFQEFLITEQELPYCIDVGNMYKISKNLSRKKINVNEFNSQTANKISKKQLNLIIDELLNKF